RDVGLAPRAFRQRQPTSLRRLVAQPSPSGYPTCHLSNRSPTVASSPARVYTGPRLKQPGQASVWSTRRAGDGDAHPSSPVRDTARCPRLDVRMARAPGARRRTDVIDDEEVTGTGGPFSLRVTDAPTQPVVLLRGELDLTSAPLLESSLAELAPRHV